MLNSHQLTVLLAGRSVHVDGVVNKWSYENEHFTVPIAKAIPRHARFLQLTNVNLSDVPKDIQYLLLSCVRPSVVNEKLLPIVFRFHTGVNNGPKVELQHEIGSIHALKFKFYSQSDKLIQKLDDVTLYCQIDFFE